MLIIYNLSGLLIGLLGILLGGIGVLLSGGLWFGVLMLAMTWLVAGIWWRKRPSDDGMTRPYPALFFIPLPYLALPLILLSGFIFVAESAGRARRSDPRVVKLDEAVRTLRTSIHGGDSLFSNTLHKALLDQADTLPDVTDAHVYSELNDEAVLVLVMDSSLKEVEKPDRQKLLDAIKDFLKKTPQTSSLKPYIGLRGKYAFGAVFSPPDSTKIDRLVSDDPLLAFYEASQTAEAKAGPAAKPPVISDSPNEADPIQQAISAIQGDERSDRWIAFQKLAKVKVSDDRRTEVARVLLDQYDRSDAVDFVYLLPAIETWATPDERFDAFARRLDDKNRQVAGTVAKALSEMNDPRAADVLLAHLADSGNADAMDRAIESLGPSVLPEVLKRRDDPDPTIRKRVYAILGKIGDAATLDVLRAASENDSDRAAQREAERAMRDLERRLKP